MQDRTIIISICVNKRCSVDFKMDQSEDASFSHTKVRSDPVNNCSPLSLLVRYNLRKNEKLMKVKKSEHTQAYEPIDQVKE